jgi:hypothetical protein
MSIVDQLKLLLVEVKGIMSTFDNNDIQNLFLEKYYDCTHFMKIIGLLKSMTISDLESK